MVTNKNEHTPKTPAKQGAAEVTPKPIKIGASTPYDFQGSHMTAYGGLLPVATMLEKLQLQQLLQRHVTIKRLTTSMPGCPFVLAMILALYVGSSRLNQLEPSPVPATRGDSDPAARAAMLRSTSIGRGTAHTIRHKGRSGQKPVHAVNHSGPRA